MVVDGKGESPSRLTSAVEGAEQRPIYHAAFDDVEYISAVPTCGSSGLTADRDRLLARITAAINNLDVADLELAACQIECLNAHRPRRAP